VDSEFGDGGTPALCRPPAGRREHDGGVPGVRHIAQDRLQDFRPLQGARACRPDRSLAAAGAIRQPAARAGRDPDRSPQGREAALGRAQDSRTSGAAAVRRRQGPQHHPRRHGLVKRGGGPRHRARGTPLSAGAAPNDLWCADFKGEFKLGNGRYCYPLTVTDHASRFLLLCEALESNREDTAFTAFERLFAERGLPTAIRSDNGVPFASPNALFNLSKLAVWWLRLGIAIERIKPGRPQQNGRHERMHLTLKKEATRPPGGNSLQQQARFDAFMHEFNTERPHEALAMKCPAELYAASPRRYNGLPEFDYPFHDRDILVTACGRICLHRKKINISTVFAGQRLGIKEVDDGVWLVSFTHYDLGYFDLEQRTLQPLDNPFGPRLSPMS
jgi:transposase InsO family protein